MAFTIGRCYSDAREHALTKVAGLMTLSLDVRAYDKSHLAALEAEFLALVAATEARRGVRIDPGKRAAAEPAPSSPVLLRELIAAAGALGVRTMPLASPASHDTATFTVAGVPSCMLFVRNANGSHNPHEAMEITDFLEAAAVLTGWLAARSVA
jgi:N-carbamoyl-L-amino-acid hydrolase